MGVAAGVLLRWCAVVAFAAVLLVHQIGEPRASIDCGVTVTGAKRVAAGNSQQWTVDLRISSRAKRIQQRERGAAVHLVDSQGRKFFPLATAADVPLDVQVGPGESADATRRFDLLPADATDVRVRLHQ